jgi:N6-L-threonylcarbamoyladenine synthase
MKLLSIETSCDETAVAVIDAKGKETDAQFRVDGNALYSQAKKHEAYGGVYPSLAKREHARNVVPLLMEALREASLITKASTSISDESRAFLNTLLRREEGLATALIEKLQTIEKPSIDAIAVTHGPGLEPALWVGINFARALAYVWDVPIIPVNHLEGHLIASTVKNSNDGTVYQVEPVSFPLLGLIVSGGHTELVHAKEWGTYNIIGATRDDSIGEAFDKVARILGLPYPGGPLISELAQRGRAIRRTNPAGTQSDITPLPRPMIQSGDLDFSFSGLKTAVLYMVRDIGELNDRQRALIAAEFETAVTDVLLKKLELAYATHETNTIVLGGGVSANTYLRERIAKQYPTRGMLRLPAKGLSTDNAIMIGMAGYFMQLRNEKPLKATDSLHAVGNLKFS